MKYQLILNKLLSRSDGGFWYVWRVKLLLLLTVKLSCSNFETDASRKNYSVLSGRVQKFTLIAPRLPQYYLKFKFRVKVYYLWCSRVTKCFWTLTSMIMKPISLAINFFLIKFTMKRPLGTLLYGYPVRLASN